MFSKFAGLGPTYEYLMYVPLDCCMTVAVVCKVCSCMRSWPLLKTWAQSFQIKVITGLNVTLPANSFLTYPAVHCRSLHRQASIFLQVLLDFFFGCSYSTFFVCSSSSFGASSAHLFRNAYLFLLHSISSSTSKFKLDAIITPTCLL